MLGRLLDRLRPQLTDEIQVLLYTDGGNRSVGVKRQILLESSTAPWLSFVDDDDLVPPDYCERISSVIFGADPPEVVGFRLKYFLDGAWAGSAVHSYNARNIPTPEVTINQTRYERNPNHLNPIRREWAMRIGYRDLDKGEDGDYAVRLSRLNPRPREAFIDRVLYEYRYSTRRAGDVTHETQLMRTYAATGRR